MNEVFESGVFSFNSYNGDDYTVSILYFVTATILFVLLAIQLLFPSNKILPLDRRTSSVTCAVLVYVLHKFLLKNDQDVDFLDAVDFDVLLLLSAIMIINFIVLHLKETRAGISKVQELIQRDPVKGFWAVSIAALVVSPFLTNDGVCLLFVAPILSAFEGLNDKDIDSEQNSIEEASTGSGGKNTKVKQQTQKYGPPLQDFELKLKSSDAIYFMLTLACSNLYW
jgi:hypothetical protein